MAAKGPGKRKIEQYRHADKQRANNPPVGLVTPATDQDAGKKTYAYDPHLDPSLQWAGKAEHTSFEVPTMVTGPVESLSLLPVHATLEGVPGTIGSGTVVITGLQRNVDVSSTWNATKSQL